MNHEVLFYLALIVLFIWMLVEIVRDKKAIRAEVERRKQAGEVSNKQVVRDADIKNSVIWKILYVVFYLLGLFISVALFVKK